MGECNTHFTTTIGLRRIDIAWSPADPLPICRGDQIVISGSDPDKYRISDDGPWITIVGDPDKAQKEQIYLVIKRDAWRVCSFRAICEC